MNNILIIDDEKQIREGLANYLRLLKTPFDQIYTASSGQETLTFFEKTSFSVALVDINLGDMNGLDLIDILSHRYPETRIVIISGFDDFEFARRAIKLNVYDYLLKPIPKSDLSRLMDTLAKEIDAKSENNYRQTDIIQKSKEYIETHYNDKNLSLNQIATRLFVSESYLSKQMKATLGKNFSDFLIDLRIEKAKELLSDPDLLYTVSQIAHKVGYEDAHYFSRLFKKKTGNSPVQFRNEKFCRIEK